MTKGRLARLIILVIVFLAVCAPAMSMENRIYLQLDGIRGGCKEAQHKGWIELRSCRCTSTGTTRETFREILVFSHELDISTSSIQQHWLDGTPIAAGVMEIYASDGTLIGRYRLHDIVVTGAHISTEEVDGSWVPVEEATLTCRKIDREYFPAEGPAPVVPKTGDTADLTLWISLLAISASGAIMLTARRRSR